MDGRLTQRGSRAPGATSARRIAPLILVALILWSIVLRGEPVGVRYRQGPLRAPLVLSALDGAVLADGDLIQSADATRVTTRVVFRFKDGSLHDETVVFSQEGRFRLIHDHLVQKGPAFPLSIDMSVDGGSGDVTVRYADRNGPERQYRHRYQLPADLANGLIPTLLENVRPEAPPKSLSLLVATPKPRLVTLAVSAALERLQPGAQSGAASHYVLKVEIGGVAGWFAPLVGKQPPDSHVWILDGHPPAFVRSEQPFYIGGPLWRIDVVRGPGNDHASSGR